MKQKFLFKLPEDTQEALLIVKIPKNKGIKELSVTVEGEVTCRICGRHLRSLKSRVIGIGPDCLKKAQAYNWGEKVKTQQLKIIGDEGHEKPQL